MRLEPRQEHTIRQEAVQRCSTCTQPIGEKPDPETTADVNLSGAAKYVVCPTCKKYVPEEFRTLPYKAAWIEKTRERMLDQAVRERQSQSESATTPENTQRETITPEEWIRQRLAFEEAIGETGRKNHDSSSTDSWPLT